MGRATQKAFPGAGPAELSKIPDLHRAAGRFLRLRNDYLDAKGKAEKAQDRVMELMHEHADKLMKTEGGRLDYRHSDMTITLKPAEKLKVVLGGTKEVADADPDDDEEAEEGE